MTVSRAAMAKETTAAVYALENLTIKVDGKQHAKVCCVCDAFIMYGDERSINVDNLKHKNVIEVLSKSWIDLLKE
jgi:alpha-D-ribose 1-methylphosphonate 5-triphosphate synthase subunit PhnG